MPKKKYEIFMSFKDKDKNGNRTESSRLAEDIFTTLTARGYRVFFSREALPGMVGGEYEPVINAALKSARLLVLVFSNAEEVNSEWVKHEWMTFSTNRKPILTVYNGCGDADWENVPYIIRKLQYCDLTDGSEREYEFMLNKIDECIRGGSFFYKSRSSRQTIKESGLSMPTISQQETKPTSPTHTQQKPTRLAPTPSAPESQVNVERAEPSPSTEKAQKREVLSSLEEYSKQHDIVTDESINKEKHNEPDQRGGNRYNYSDFVFPNKRIKVGDKLQFGQYPQGANGEVEPLVWRVLAVENGRALLITDKLIDAVPYNEKMVDVTWETCTLRKWMNNDFISKAFSSSQQSNIAIVTNHNTNNQQYDIKSVIAIVYVNAIYGRVFALSKYEAEKYFRDDDDRTAYTTDYVHKKVRDFKDRSHVWWLRSRGSNNNRAACVLDWGLIFKYGMDVNFGACAIRPAFWLNLE